MTGFGDWYGRSLIEDDPRASAAFDESFGEAIPTHVGVQKSDPRE